MTAVAKDTLGEDATPVTEGAMHGESHEVAAYGAPWRCLVLGMRRRLGAGSIARALWGDASGRAMVQGWEARFPTA